MTILSVDKLAKYYGSRCLFEQASFHLEEKDHVGLVGANGTGKSTLFKLLLGQESCDAGGVVRTNGLTIGSMEQHVPEDERQTANEWILSAFSDLLLMEEQLNEMQQHVEAGNTDDALLMKWQHLQEQYQQEGGLYFRSKARSALLGLGLTEEQIHLPLASLSGGQRSKLGLARLLVSRASLLLLDEPTNHLDITAIEWLEEFLRSYEGAYIVVSHDRYFLDRVTTKTMELEHRKLRLFRGNYSAYLEYKKQNREIEEHHYRQQVKEIERLEDAVTEMRRW
ncbi:MAG: ABC-F family ATP-binding cassette domain-containing protein, partial [Clostridia bacterium]|nr:ABC-F family ATP-binding cassette domain-containing protein [Clostridia bacterium]